MPISSIYKQIITIPAAVIDENGHVNNVAYIQWMQDIAIEHYAAIGGIAAQGANATWVVRQHHVEYFLPAFLGEQVEVRTWVENIRKVRSLRMYEFVRLTDGKPLVTGVTDWVFVDIKTGKPLLIPESVIAAFQSSIT